MPRSEAVRDFLAKEISPHTYVNVMAQYRPCYRAGECPKVDRYPTRREFLEAYDYAAKLGLRLARWACLMDVFTPLPLREGG